MLLYRVKNCGRTHDYSATVLYQICSIESLFRFAMPSRITALHHITTPCLTGSNELGQLSSGIMLYCIGSSVNFGTDRVPCVICLGIQVHCRFGREAEQQQCRRLFSAYSGVGLPWQIRYRYSWWKPFLCNSDLGRIPDNVSIDSQHCVHDLVADMGDLHLIWPSPSQMMPSHDRPC